MNPKKLLSLIPAMLMALLLTLTFAPTASAETTEKAVALGTAALSGYDNASNSYKYTYYGTYESTPIKWRILAMNGNNGTYKDGNGNEVYAGNAMFLLSEYALKKTIFSSRWLYSNVRKWCNDTTDNTSFISSSFTDSEKTYLLKTSTTVLEDESSGTFVFEMEDDTFFFLSSGEAFRLGDMIAKLMSEPDGDAVYWWTRSQQRGVRP